MYRRVFFIVLFALSTFALTLRQPLTEKIDPIVERCSKAHPVSENIFLPRPTNITINDLKNTTTGCYIACVWEATGQMNPDGTVIVPSITDRLPNNLANRDKVIQAFRDCYNKRGKNKCETSSKVMVCFFTSEEILNMHPIGYLAVRPLH